MILVSGAFWRGLACRMTSSLAGWRRTSHRPSEVALRVCIFRRSTYTFVVLPSVPPFQEPFLKFRLVAVPGLPVSQPVPSLVCCPACLQVSEAATRFIEVVFAAVYLAQITYHPWLSVCKFACFVGFPNFLQNSQTLPSLL